MIKYIITYKKMKSSQFEHFRLWFSTMRRSIFIDLVPDEKRFYSLNAKSSTILDDRIILEYDDSSKFLKFLERRFHRLIVLTLKELKFAELEIIGKKIIYRDFVSDIYRAAGYESKFKVIEDEKAVIAKKILEEKIEKVKILPVKITKKPIKKKPAVKVPKKKPDSRIESLSGRKTQKTKKKIKKPKTTRSK